MNYELLSLYGGLMLFAYWLNYCMGSPLAKNTQEVDVNAIFFSLPYWLAVRKLRQYHVWDEITAEFNRELQVTHGARDRNNAKKEHARHVFATGREFFTWEKSILCPVCFHFWISLLAWAFFVQDAVLISALYYLAFHLFIRKIL